MAEKERHTVLVVDDDPGHRGMLEALLSRWGLAVTSAPDGKEAVERVCERPFDMVLMDIRMPDMDGITALKEIRKYNPAVPVVLMTAYSAVESAVEAMKSAIRSARSRGWPGSSWRRAQRTATKAAWRAS